MKKLELRKCHRNNEIKYICINKRDTFLSVKYMLHKIIDVSVKSLVICSDINAFHVKRSNDFIPEHETTFYYNILQEPTLNDVILQFKRNYFDVPKYVQISKFETIQRLKELINYTNSGLELFLFDSKGILLVNDNKSIEECGLSDNSKLMVWQGNNLNVELKICDPLIKITEKCPSQIICTLNCTINDSVEKVKNDISKFMNLGKEMNLALYSELSVLHNEKFLVDYPIRNSNNIIYFVDLIKTEKIDQGEEISKRKCFKMLKGKILSTNKTVIINKYKTENPNEFERKSLKYEIITHLKLTACKKSLFVQLISLYEEKFNFNIVVEYMAQGSLKDLYFSRELSTDEILNYSYQILEALSFMHDNFIIHRAVKCSSVLLHDDRKKIKLTNFHLSKFLFNNTFEDMEIGIKASEHGKDSEVFWVAPEVLRKELYGLKADIWSFGATVIEMLTRDHPFAGFNPGQALHIIANGGPIPFNLNLNPAINTLVERCIIGEQLVRPVASQLMKDSVIFNRISDQDVLNVQ